VPRHASPIPAILRISLATLSAIVLGACGTPGTARPAIEPSIHPTEARTDLVPGRTLVLPVTLEGPYDPTRPLPVVLDDGRKLPASLHWISVAPRPDAAPAWLPPDGVWSSTPANAGVRPPGVGFWAVVVDVPIDALGQGFWLGRERTPLNWLPDPEPPPAAGRAPRAVNADPAVASRLERFLETERASPLRRWRYRLLTAGLGGSVGSDAFPDSVLEALARQVESRWRVALDRLAREDRDLAERVRQRLVTTVDFGAGVMAPAWPAVAADLDTLQLDLLDPRSKPGDRASRARGWLDSLPQASAWVVDDAGMSDAMTAAPLVTLGVANLSDRATLAWATTSDGTEGPELVPVEPGVTRQLTIALPRDAAQPGGPAVDRVTVHAGRWAVQLPVPATRMQAAPPGLRLGPFYRDWTMPAWLAGAAQGLQDVTASDGSAWDAAGVLLRAEPAADSNSSGWTLIVECRQGATHVADETLRVWFGPFGSPSATVRVTRSGAISDESRVPKGLDAGASVARREDRWMARLSVPASCVEPDGTIRLGLERVDALGRHSAWPRPMLPWQFEPARAAIDTRAWGGIAARGMP
jgi:hypothetical protein